MGTCVTPCNTNDDGICVIRGTRKSCEGGKGLTLLEIGEIVAAADTVRLSPAYLDKFGIAMQDFQAAFSFKQADGIIEITGKS